MIDSTQFYGGIFLDAFQLGHACFLKERWLTTLKQRIYTAKVRGTGAFTQQEIVNTFMPILRALSQKFIPSFYTIDCQKIVLDSNSNIRLRKVEKQSIDQQNEQNLNLHQQLAVVVLEASLFLTHEAAINLSKNQEKAVRFLLQRQFGYKVIGIVIILLNEGKKRLPINLEQAINYELANQWFLELKANIEKCREQNEMKKPENIGISNKVIYKMVRRNETRCEDETQDSPNQTLAKYRSGKRLISDKNEESVNKPDLTETLLKPRKDRQRPNFN